MGREPSDISERHLRLLRQAYEEASHDISGIASIYRVAEKLGLDVVGREADREEYITLARELEEAGYLRKAGPEHTSSYGNLVVTKEGARLVEEHNEPPQE